MEQHRHNIPELWECHNQIQATLAAEATRRREVERVLSLAMLRLEHGYLDDMAEFLAECRAALAGAS